MSAQLINWIGWFPAIVFPLATALQLIKMLRARSVAGVSRLTWGLFASANVCMYIYMEKYFEPQSAGLLFNALLQIVIVLIVALAHRRERKMEEI